jgi:hypothetical protein
MKRVMLVLVGLTFVVSYACKKYEITPGNDANFKIVENKDSNFKKFDKKVVVFDIPIYANKKVEDIRLLHIANVMAEYLDNDEDGNIDNPLVHEHMISNGAFMVIWKKQSNLWGMSQPDNMMGQDCGNDETRPEWHENKTGRFDASLEEVLHIITHSGYASAYPEVFGETKNTEVAKAMDIARGGYFEEIPSTYPPEAWYSYDDKTCTYDCMVTEYTYWALTSLLGAQVNRFDEISQEWRLVSPEEFIEHDEAMYNILTNPEYKLPTRLPDGKYEPVL